MANSHKTLNISLKVASFTQCFTGSIGSSVQAFLTQIGANYENVLLSPPQPPSLLGNVVVLVRVVFISVHVVSVDEGLNSLF